MNVYDGTTTTMIAILVGTMGVKARAPPMVLSKAVPRFRFLLGAPADHIKIQLHPFVGGAYGSSALLTGPQTDGICGRVSKTFGQTKRDQNEMETAGWNESTQH